MSKLTKKKKRIIGIGIVVLVAGVATFFVVPKYLSVKKGDFVAIVGESGSGKSAWLLSSGANQLHCDCSPVLHGNRDVLRLLSGE